MTDEPIPFPSPNVPDDELEIVESREDAPVEDGTTGWPGLQEGDSE